MEADISYKEEIKFVDSRSVDKQYAVGYETVLFLQAGLTNDTFSSNRFHILLFLPNEYKHDMAERKVVAGIKCPDPSECDSASALHVFEMLET